jgi:hypothetical protein
MSLGAMPHDKILHSMELLATKVVACIKKYTTQKIAINKAANKFSANLFVFNLAAYDERKNGSV